MPDLTALVGGPADIAARLSLTVPPLLHEVDAAVVSATHAAVARSVRALARSLGWAETTIRRRVHHLVRQGALIEIAPDRFIRPDALKPLGRIYAVEAKVEKWSQAVRQARSYAVWSDAYV
jgi:DNA-binding Lrp family transcriptional regulator